MRIEYQKGDFIAGTEHLIVHGCNAQGVMGRGAALAVRRHLPFAFNAYWEAFEESHMAHLLGVKKGIPLGEVVWAIALDAGSARIVGNMITQQHWRPDMAVDGRQVDYAAVRKALHNVANFVRMTQHGQIAIENITPIKRVGMPKVGAGLGGGDWSTIASIIEEESAKVFQPVVYIQQ